jgi:hypothetical protein
MSILVDSGRLAVTRDFPKSFTSGWDLEVDDITSSAGLLSLDLRCVACVFRLTAFRVSSPCVSAAPRGYRASRPQQTGDAISGGPSRKMGIVRNRRLSCPPDDSETRV